MEAGLPGVKPSWMRARVGVDRGRPYQLVQLASRIEAPALIAWWVAEVLNNGLAECCSPCRGGLHLLGSRPSTQGFLLSPGQPSPLQLCATPRPCPFSHPRTEKTGSGPTWPQPRAGKGHGHKWPDVPQPGPGESFLPANTPLLTSRLSSEGSSLVSPSSTWSDRALCKDVPSLQLGCPLCRWGITCLPCISARDERCPCPESSLSRTCSLEQLGPFSGM